MKIKLLFPILDITKTTDWENYPCPYYTLAFNTGFRYNRWRSAEIPRRIYIQLDFRILGFGLSITNCDIIRNSSI